jgi:polar amino acid transport system substrate-binding protein
MTAGAAVQMIHAMVESGCRRRGALAAVLVAAALVPVACGTGTTSPAGGEFKPRTPGVLTVVTTDVPSPGFWEGTPAHITGGFEFELAKELAHRLGLGQVQVRIEDFHRIVAGELDGADVALDLITPTDERSRSLTFSWPYLDVAPTVLARAGTSVPDLETAQGLRWGAVRATTFVKAIADRIRPNAPPRIYANTSDMVGALEARQVDAVLLDLPAAVATADRSQGRLHAAAQLPENETIAAALPKGSVNEQAVSSAFRAFTADGTISRLLRVWVGPEAANAEKSIPLLETTL